MDDQLQRGPRFLVAASRRRADERPFAHLPVASVHSPTHPRVADGNIRQVHRVRVDRAKGVPDGQGAGKNPKGSARAEGQKDVAQETAPRVEGAFTDRSDRTRTIHVVQRCHIIIIINY